MRLAKLLGPDLAQTLAQDPHELTEYIALAPNTKTWQASDSVRHDSRQDKAETVYYACVAALSHGRGVICYRRRQALVTGGFSP
jgi:hypothetical protein